MNPTTDTPNDRQPTAPTQNLQNIPELKQIAKVSHTSFTLATAGTIILALLAVLLINPLIGLCIVCLGICGYVLFTSGNLFKDFAKANNYTYVAQGFVENQSGVIFSIGFGPAYDDIVYGLYKDWPFFLFLYSYSMGYEENSRRYARTVLSIDFVTELPAFVLRKHKLLQVFEEEGESLKEHGYIEKLALEGDFDTYFQVFIRPDTQVEVLTILTPDVMELVMKLDKYEIEVTADGKIYVYFHSAVRHQQELENTYAIIGTLVPKIQAYLNKQQELTGNNQAYDRGIITTNLG